MSPVVNFLPWRRARFYQHLRHWGMFVCASALICTAAALALCTHWRSVRAVHDIHMQAERQITLQLAQREQERSAQAKQQALLQQRLAHRRETQAWSQQLLEIVERLPAQAWLNALSYRDGALMMSGTLTQFAALTVLDRGLQTLPGFQPGKAGKIQRDSAGRWVFEYRLQKDVAYAAP